MTAGPDTAAVAEGAVGTKAQRAGVNQEKGQNQMTRENTVNVPREPDSGLLSVIASMVRRIAVPTSIDPDEVYFDNGHARQIYKAITDAAPLHEGEGELGNHDCLAKRRPGEPMFILLGRDPDAHNVVRFWADRRLAAGGDPEHCRMGHDTADRMKAYASDPANAPASAPSASSYAAPPPSVEGFGSSSLKGEDTHRVAETAVVGDLIRGLVKACQPIAEKARRWDERHGSSRRDSVQIQHRIGDFRRIRDLLDHKSCADGAPR